LDSCAASFGDFGYALPWAAQPIGFAVGTEFRKYKALQRPDVLAKSSGELGGAGGPTPEVDGGYAVYEGYGELIAPLVEDKPFFESLTLETGVRYSLYEIDERGSNDAWTWKAGGSWEPGYGLKIRGNYSRAVRARTSASSSRRWSAFDNLALDPCAGTAARSTMPPARGLSCPGSASRIDRPDAQPDAAQAKSSRRQS
jgi:outer membrane receptor protein involved in Fe transport